MSPETKLSIELSDMLQGEGITNLDDFARYGFNGARWDELTGDSLIFLKQHFDECVNAYKGARAG